MDRERIITNQLRKEITMDNNNNQRTLNQAIREDNVTFAQCYGLNLEKLFNECFNGQSDKIINQMTSMMIKAFMLSDCSYEIKGKVKDFLSGIKSVIKNEKKVSFDENKTAQLPKLLFGMDCVAC